MGDRQHVLVLGKYPPIQGGTSTDVFRSTASLAADGRRVTVLSNSACVHPSFEVHYTQADRQFIESLHARVGLVVKSITSPSRASYIPWADPFVSRLIGQSLRIDEEYPVDLIVGWYLEPYGVAATVLGEILARPVVLLHAGSDIGRLMAQPDLSVTYRWALRRCTRIITQTRHIKMFVDMGVEREAISIRGSEKLPDDIVCATDPLALEEYASEFPAWQRRVAPDLSLNVPSDTYPESAGVVKIGMCGKIGRHKGTYEALEAMDQLSRHGTPLHFVTLSCGWPAELRRFWTTLFSDSTLARRVTVSPAIPPWRMGQWYRSVDVVLFLENNFPIDFHSPSVPYEVLASGRCLMVSEEVARKMFCHENIVHRKNAILVKNPSDSGEIVRELQWIAEDPERANVIGARARLLVQFLEGYKEPGSSLAPILDSCVAATRHS